MVKLRSTSEPFRMVRHVVWWSFLVLPVAVSVGIMVAVFLWLLEQATQLRHAQMWLIWLLPLAGVGIYALYHYWGQNSEAGNNLIMDEIHEPGGGIPFRMAPLVLLTTVLTHLFGGSAGREGTAVQMGGSVAEYIGKRLGLTRADQRILLMSGMAAGFGAVFGTPVTGAIFALEVLAVGRIKYDALLPCLIASLLADVTCNAFPIHHTEYTIAYSAKAALGYFSLDLVLLLKIMIAGACFGLASYAFAELSHWLKSTSHALISRKWLIPVLGGGLVLGISGIIGSYDYLGLGVRSPDPEGVSIVSAFSAGGADPFSWFWKLVLTAITLSLGFKGGEVTPLFFIGATLGNSLAMLSGAPVDLFAGLGFIAVFAGATNTPIACTLMGIELFGAENTVYFAVACFMAYYFSGHTGIYQSQRVAVSKFHTTESNESTLKEIKSARRRYGRGQEPE
ncbi:voltage-gated chloride channel family protein [Coraliomargarita sp. SDUM461004]|uniref:Voltage-gated chloride channel family protein n=1 Tax=Thalassobacterium sedimentorum TaxID=3041258 RepID=A0ABU1AHG0_9BACT|nr:voltage-gated chloride channel family protein [Coraliomargarita sp. SDUM461004]MDQ8193623.1 voltage-gated chloride channel family protein [Coraliomargarita sp. SDUM461004]